MKINIKNLSAAPALQGSGQVKKRELSQLMNAEISLFPKGFGLNFKEKFYYKLVVLSGSGLDLLASVELLSREQKKKSVKAFYDQLLIDLSSGKTLSESMAKTNKFSDFETYSIKVAEETGNFTVIFNELHIYFKRALKFQKQLISSISYPGFILGFSFVVVFVLFKFLVPLFSGIYKKFDGELPQITQTLIKISELFSAYALYAIFFFLLLAGFLFAMRKKELVQKYAAKILIGMPLFGSVVKKLYLAKFAQVMALMVKSKVPLLNSVQLLQKIIPFYPIKKAVIQAEMDIAKGIGFSDSLEAASFFPIGFVSLLRVGEETNNLDGIFNNLTDQYNREIDQSTELLSKLLEPLLIVFLGLIIGLVLVAMYLPLFQMSTRFS